MDFLDFGGLSADELFNQTYGGVTDFSDVLGSGMYGTGSDDMAGLFGTEGFDPEMLGQAAVQGYTSRGDGLTGIGPLDHVINSVSKSLGERWEKDPLSMIGAGIGILGKIHAMTSGGKSSGGGGVGGTVRMPPRAEDAFRDANPAANTFPARVAPRGGTVQPGGLSQIPVKRVL